MGVHVARVYDEPGPKDGRRVLVDRLWPRGLSKAAAKVDVWDKDVAPSADLRRWYGHDPDKAEEFVRRYRAELDSGPAAEALADLVATARDSEVTLLTATKDVALSQAQVLHDVIADRLSS